jgi:hypothetical protein
MIDSIDTDRAHENETFRASLDKDVVVDGKTIIPRRSDVYVKVIEVQQAGKLKGQSELQVQLDRVVIGKQAYPVTSNTFGRVEGKKAVRNVGNGAAVGGVLGGISAEQGSGHRRRSRRWWCGNHEARTNPHHRNRCCSN